MRRVARPCGLVSAATVLLVRPGQPRSRGQGSAMDVRPGPRARIASIVVAVEP